MKVFQSAEYLAIPYMRMKEIVTSGEEFVTLDFSRKSKKGVTLGTASLPGHRPFALHPLHPPITRVAAVHRYKGTWNIPVKFFTECFIRAKPGAIFQLTIWPEEARETPKPSLTCIFRTTDTSRAALSSAAIALGGANHG